MLHHFLYHQCLTSCPFQNQPSLCSNNSAGFIFNSTVFIFYSAGFIFNSMVFIFFLNVFSICVFVVRFWWFIWTKKRSEFPLNPSVYMGLRAV